MPLKLVNLSFYADVIIAPVVLHIPAILAANTQKDVKVAAQNSSNYGFGAFTG
jgi:triosephosphate isomerase